jgi:hypothetical protein
MATRRGPDNSARIAITGTFDSNSWANVFHAQLATSSTISAADLLTWLTAYQAAYKTNIGAIQSTSVTYSQAQAVVYAPGGGEVAAQVAMTGGGTDAGGIVTNSGVCKVISWTSSVYWRGGKPRTYSPSALSADMANDHQLTGGAITSTTTAGTNFRTAVNALTAGTITGTQHGFISFMTGNVPRSPAVFFPITGATCHSRVGTQRRRLGKWHS